MDFDSLRRRGRNSSVQREFEAKRRRELSMGRLLAGYAAAPAGFVVDAADLDGTNDRLTQTTMTGQSSQVSGTISFWISPDTLAHNHEVLFVRDAGGFNPCVITLQTSGFFTLDNNTNGVGLCTRMANNLTAISASTWSHVAFSWNGTTNQMYVNGTAQTFSTDTHTGGATSWDVADNWYVGRDGVDTAGTRLDGGLAELYVHHTTRIDLSASLTLFRTAGGKPVDLGATGSTPTGTQPILYLHLDDGEAAANFAANAGGGGGMTVVGTLTTYASSPSD